METLLDLFNKNKLDISEIEEKLDIKIERLTFGMTPFQINHFVMNKQEFPTSYAQFMQARLEIYTRINTFIDMYYQYRECNAKIMLAEGRMEKIDKEETYSKIRDARLELQRIEIDKNREKLNSIKSQAEDKIKEMQVFYGIYKGHRHFETAPPEEIQVAEEESWKIKSAYYPELGQRYGLVPEGFITLPHENGGLKKLIELTKEAHRGNNVKAISES